ncbi:SAC3/GANP/Nin1/mts3/eIF-3 p25 family-domain-containing protein [Pisolithus microcarpus]|nr:SAC3/GANP/Nin1/mts3/eIF-3 p25 family-domain-containing protein [Pisolithus microcarpus]
MEPAVHRATRGRGLAPYHEGGNSKRPLHRNRQWVADGVTSRSGMNTPQAGGDGDRWERGGTRGSKGRARGTRGKSSNVSVTPLRRGVVDGGTTASEGEHSEVDDETEVEEVYPPDPETPEERERFWQELVKNREAERKKAIAEGKMDDPLVQKSLKDAITMVGTCSDMCPRFERYRRERENNLTEWETIPGTKRVDHKRAVKMYERAAGDKTLPSDLRPPKVLKRTLDYLFHDLLPRGGFSATFSFIRDRSRAVRNDFTMQHEMGPLAIECHDRCARFHILAIHLERNSSGFSIPLEEQQLMNTLQSLKEFYEDQRGCYQSPTELEMRVYHRLIHIRDQRERHEDIPDFLLKHPVFELTTRFRARVQAKSAPITKTSALAVDAEAMQIFVELATVLRREGNVVMTYLIACILERLFGKDTIEDIEAIRGELTYSDIIDGYSGPHPQTEDTEDDPMHTYEDAQGSSGFVTEHPPPQQSPRASLPNGAQWMNDDSVPKPTESTVFNIPSVPISEQVTANPVASAFSNLPSVPNVFGTGTFGVLTTSETHPPTAPPPVFLQGPPSSNQPSFTPAVSSSGPIIPSALVGGRRFVESELKPESEQVASAALNLLRTVPSPPPSSLSATQTAGNNARPVQLSSVFEVQSTPSLLQTHPIVSSSTVELLIPSTSSSSSIPPVLSSLNTTNLTLETRPQPADESIPVTQPGSFDQQKVPISSNLPPAPPAPTPDLTLPSTTSGSFQETPPSQPPPLNRHQPISLPPTPTATIFIPNSATPSQGSRRNTSSLRSIQTSSLSASATEILSPLIIPSPSTSKFLASSAPHLLRRDSFQSPLRSSAVVASSETYNDMPKANSLAQSDQIDVMGAAASRFARKCYLVKTYFSQWRRRLSDRAKWIEACKRSQEYSERVHAERLSRSTATAVPPKKRRIVPTEDSVPRKRRAKSRPVSEFKSPQTDEELARRFETNHEEHAHRWARGSFLHLLQSYLDPSSSRLPPNWAAWLSLNQENDGTAIWLEQKFDVPESGQWKSGNVFEMPISQSHIEVERFYPGVIIFERTPMSGTDVIEKKYRILDDCARLREIIKTLPPDRHYVPSLLCISWTSEPPDVTKDFDDMVVTVTAQGLLASCHQLSVTSRALDTESNFEVLLRSISFDRDGHLVRSISIDGVLEDWESIWDEMTTWVAKCTIRGEFNWDLHFWFLHGVVKLLDHLVNSAVGLFGKDIIQADLTHLQPPSIVDSDSTFDTVLDWLEQLPPMDVKEHLIKDITTHRSLGRDFPTLSFVSQAYTLASALVAYNADLDPGVHARVRKDSLEHAKKSLLSFKSNLEDEFNSHIARLRHPPKRVPSSNSDRSACKKRRVSDSEASVSTEDLESLPFTSHEPSPSLSAATSVQSLDRTPLVTPAMLRSLTRDVRGKYGHSTPSLLGRR